MVDRNISRRLEFEPQMISSEWTDRKGRPLDVRWTGLVVVRAKYSDNLPYGNFIIEHL